MNNFADFKPGDEVKIIAKSFKESGSYPHSEHGGSHNCIGEIARVWKHCGNRIAITRDGKANDYIGQFYPSELEKLMKEIL